MQRRHDREPVFIGVALAVGPPAVSGMIFLVNQIRTAIENYELNEESCIELHGHIYEVGYALESIPEKYFSHEDFQQTLTNLQVYLEECFQLVNKYGEKSSIEQFLRSRSYKRKFDKVNAQLARAKERLTFILRIHSFVKNKANHLSTTSLNFDGQHRHTPVNDSLKISSITLPTITYLNDDELEQFTDATIYNQITKVYLEKMNTFDDILFLLDLFPRLKSLQIDIDIQLFSKVILMKIKNQEDFNLYLLSITIPTVDDQMMNEIQNFIDLQKSCF
ncbi:hypothetical protein I4U23_016529 [Adineta vaga]|nr:hypothetical protein I4U23_016529 [Adineta vaga]